jgi:hypothetical protein
MMQCKSCLARIPENLCEAHAQLSHDGFAVFYPYVEPQGGETMSTLNINIDNHGQEYTVSEMRRRLAQVLSKLHGDQKVTFAFRAELSDYQHVPVVPPTLKSPAGYPPVGGILFESTVYSELARPSNE